MVGSEVELSCVDFKENAFDLNELHVYWQITVNGKTKTVAYYLSENSSAVYVDAQYKGRAQLSQAGMRHGDFSLRLRNVTPQDEQKFNCLVFKKFERALNVTVALHVAGEGAGVAVASPQPRGPGGAGGPGSSREAKPGSAAGSRVTVCEAERAGSPPARRNAACGPGRPGAVPGAPTKACCLCRGLATSARTRFLRCNLEGALKDQHRGRRLEPTRRLGVQREPLLPSEAGRAGQGVGAGRRPLG